MTLVTKKHVFALITIISIFIILFNSELLFTNYNENFKTKKNVFSGFSSQPTSQRYCDRSSSSERIQLHRSPFNDEGILQITKVKN